MNGDNERRINVSTLSEAHDYEASLWHGIAPLQLIKKRREGREGREEEERKE